MTTKAEEKLHEAGSLLNQMIEQERLIFPDQAKLNADLNGFLAAGKTVRNQFPTQAIKAWEANLTPDKALLWEFMRKERNRDQHKGRPRRRVKNKKIEVGIGSTASDKSGTLSAMGSPWAGPAHILKPTCYFTIGGTERKATEACREYLALLDRMVAAFKS
jgi:hypothetical protein